MGERKVIGLFQRSPRPKWRELTGAMRSLTVARDFQKFARKNVGSRVKAGRSTNHSITRSSSKTSSWMTSDEDDDDDDFAELSDFEIDEDETSEKPRFSDTFSSCVSTDIFPNKISKSWDEDSVPVLNFDSAIKSTPIEKQQEHEEVSSEINFENGVLASSTPKSNKMKPLNAMNESESKLALELEGNILPVHQEKPALDLKADLFDRTHKDVEIPEMSMSDEKQVPNSIVPSIQSHLHQTILSSSQNKTGVLNGGSGHNLKNISFRAIEKSPECDCVAHSLNTSVEDIEIPESIIYDEKGDPFNISNSLNKSSHLDETMCSKTIESEQFAEPREPDPENDSFEKFLKNIKSKEKDENFNKSIFSNASGRLDEALQAADSSSSLNKTLVSTDEKGKNLKNISICMLTKLPKLRRKLAFRRSNPKKPTDIPKQVVL